MRGLDGRGSCVRRAHPIKGTHKAKTKVPRTEHGTFVSTGSVDGINAFRCGGRATPSPLRLDGFAAPASWTQFRR